MKTMSLNNTFRALNDRVKQKSIIADQNFNEKLDQLINESSSNSIVHIIAIFTIILPISTFLYWRLLFEEFNANYFENFFDINDVYYLLYYKATTLMYIMLLLLAAIVAILTSFRTWKFKTIASIFFFLGIVVFVFSDQAHFAWSQSLLYSIATLVLFVFFIYRGKKALYGYIILSCLFLVTSAKTDAEHYKQANVRKDILLKDGSYFLKKNDKFRYYITSTSKYVLIYDIPTKQLINAERDSIKY